MSRTKYIIWSAFMALVAVGCSNDDSSLPPQPFSPVALTIETDVEGADTRALKTGFVTDDYIYVTGMIGSTVQNSANLKYRRTDEATWEPADLSNTFFYQSEDEVTFSAVYIGDQEWTLSENDTKLIELQADDAHEHDFLFAEGAVGSTLVDDGKIYFRKTDDADTRFKHVMSKLKFTFSPGYNSALGAEPIDLAGLTFKVTGFVTSGTMNYETGETAVSTTASPQTISGEGLTYTTDETGKVTEVSGYVLVFPQSVNPAMLIATVGNFKYKLVLWENDSFSFTYEKGYEYSYPLTVGTTE